MLQAVLFLGVLTAGTPRTDAAVFAGLLIATIGLLALLDFVPALMLGPLADGLDTRLR